MLSASCVVGEVLKTKRRVARAISTAPRPGSCGPEWMTVLKGLMQAQVADVNNTREWTRPSRRIGGTTRRGSRRWSTG